MITYYLYRKIYRGDYYIVKQNWLYRWLTQPDGTVHSRINRWSLHRPCLEYMKPMLKLCNQPDGDYLMLGLGGGALLHALQHQLAHPTFDVVEINPEVISLAKQYFYLDKINTVNLFQQDANDFISHCKKQYDVILVDIYQDKVYPRHCATQEFFKACQNLLKNDGILAINCANMSQYTILLNQLRNVFNHSVLTIRVTHPRNVILAATNQPFQTLLNRVQLKDLKWHEKTGAIGTLQP